MMKRLARFLPILLAMAGVYCVRPVAPTTTVPTPAEPGIPATVVAATPPGVSPTPFDNGIRSGSTNGGIASCAGTECGQQYCCERGSTCSGEDSCLREPGAFSCPADSAGVCGHSCCPAGSSCAEQGDGTSVCLDHTSTVRPLCNEGFLRCGTSSLCCPTVELCLDQSPQVHGCQVSHCPSEAPVRGWAEGVTRCCPEGHEVWTKDECRASFLAGTPLPVGLVEGTPLECSSASPKRCGKVCCAEDAVCGEEGCGCTEEAPLPCLDSCCPPGSWCSPAGCARCPASHPEICGMQCVIKGGCNARLSAPECSSALPVQCGANCCPAGSVCGARGTCVSCPGFDVTGALGSGFRELCGEVSPVCCSGTCTPAGRCCPSNRPVVCGAGCCAGDETCTGLRCTKSGRHGI